MLEPRAMGFLRLETESPWYCSVPNSLRSQLYHTSEACLDLKRSLWRPTIMLRISFELLIIKVLVDPYALCLMPYELLWLPT